MVKRSPRFGLRIEQALLLGLVTVFAYGLFQFISWLLPGKPVLYWQGMVLLALFYLKWLLTVINYE